MSDLKHEEFLRSIVDSHQSYKSIDKWTDAEIIKCLRDARIVLSARYTSHVSEKEIADATLHQGHNVLLMASELKKRVGAKVPIGPDAYIRQYREITVAPGSIVVGEVQKEMVLGMAVGSKEEATAIVASSVMLTASRAELRDGKAVIVGTADQIYPQRPVLQDSSHPTVKALTDVALKNATNLTNQQLRIAEEILKQAKKSEVTTFYLINALLQGWEAKSPLTSVMQAPKGGAKLPAGMTRAFTPCPPPRKPDKPSQVGPLLVKYLDLHRRVRGQDKAKLTALTHPSYIGDVGGTTNVLTVAMAMEAILSTIGSVISGEETKFFRMEGFKRDVVDQLSKSFAIYDPNAEDYDTDCKPGYYYGTEYYTVKSHCAEIPSVTSKGVYTRDPGQVVEEVRRLLERNYIIEVYGYEEIFKAFSDKVLMHPMGHKGTVFVAPVTLSVPYTYESFLVHTEYCAMWKTFFPFHRRPLWQVYTCGYSMKPIHCNSRRRIDALAMSLNMDMVVEEGAALAIGFEQDFDYDRLASPDGTVLPDIIPALRRLNEVAAEPSAEELAASALLESMMMGGSPSPEAPRPAPLIKKKVESSGVERKEVSQDGEQKVPRQQQGLDPPPSNGQRKVPNQGSVKGGERQFKKKNG